MDDPSQPFSYVPTTCPFCGVGCGLNLVVCNGRLVGVEPFTRSPVNEGKLCLKGATCWEFVQSPDRLKRPLIREGRRFREASWDEALDLIALRLRETADASGPASLGFQVSCRTTNEDCYAMQKWARVAFRTNNIDNCARICHAPSVAGLTLSFGSGAATNPFEDILNAGLILVWGSNAAEAHPLAARRIIQARQKGVPVVVIDPRYTPTARLADTYIRINPSTHIALANSLMYWIIREGLENREFIRTRTGGFDELKKVVEKYADAHEIHGVPLETVRNLARRYATAGAAVILYCLGITELTTGTDNVRSIGNLALLTGNVGRPGTGVNPLRGQNNVQGACDMGAYPNVFSGYQPVSDARVRAAMEKSWHMAEGSLPGWYGATLTGQMNDCGKTIRALYILGLNPVVSYPDSGHVKKCLDQLDFCVVQDIFWTETCEYAHVVLPGTCFAEKEGTFTSGERRINRVRKAVDGPGEAKQDWEVFSLLAGRMGLPGFDWKTSVDVWDDMRTCTPPMSGAGYEKMEKPESVHWPCPAGSLRGTPILHQDTFATPDGRGQFFGIEYRLPAETADAEYPFTLMTGRSAFEYHTRTQTGRCRDLQREAPGLSVQISPQDAAVLGIGQGERVQIRSRRGRTIATARVTPDIMQGVLFMPMHFADGANTLTSTAADPLSGMPELKHCAVAIGKMKEPCNSPP